MKTPAHSQFHFLSNFLLKRSRRRAGLATLLVLFLCSVAWFIFHPFRNQDQILTVAYDASRDYFSAINQAWEKRKNLAPDHFRVAHAGSVRQAQALAQGLQADIICLASDFDLNYVAERNHQLDSAWREAFPYEASPFFTTLVMLVREDKTSLVHNWNDLFKHELNILIPNPRVSGAGQHAYLTLLMIAQENHPDDPRAAKAAVTRLFLEAKLIDAGSYQALQALRQRPDTEVFITWENLALLNVEQFSGYSVVTPPTGLIAEPRIARLSSPETSPEKLKQILDYLHFLYSPMGQAITSQAGLRPRHLAASSVAPRHFTTIRLDTIEKHYGSWKSAWETHFSPDGSFEKILRIRAARVGGYE